jgi:hypothetical protein
MFGLFTPSCPVELPTKTWVERRMLWLAERLGIHRLANCQVVTPTDEFFPDRYDADYPSVRLCLDRMCGYMGVDPGAITLEVLPDEALPNAAGLYEMRTRGNVCIAQSQLADPARLMATLAHEIAHEILLRGAHLTGTESDHEYITDLLTAFLGVGIFGANATIRTSSWHGGGMSWWSISRLGYLSSIEFGYALALVAFVRREVAPAWARHLRTDARKTLSAGLRFLEKTGDSLFTPNTAGKRKATTSDDVFGRLAARSPTVRLAALWDVTEHALSDPKLLTPVLRCASEHEGAIRAAATRAVAVFGSAARHTAPQLVDLLHDPEPSVRASAALTLGALTSAAGTVVPELTRLLLAEDTATEAARALLAYGTDAAPCLSNLLVALERSRSTFTDATPLFFVLLRTICPEPEQKLRHHFGERDPDLLRLALAELKRRY